MLVLLFPFLIVAVNSNTFDGIHLARPILLGGMGKFYNIFLLIKKAMTLRKRGINEVTI